MNYTSMFTLNSSKSNLGSKVFTAREKLKIINHKIQTFEQCRKGSYPASCLF